MASSLSAPIARASQALDHAAKGRCTLSIAHRLSTIVACDEIVVLRAGEAIERGAHEALLAAGGLYASMWAKQKAAQRQ